MNRDITCFAIDDYSQGIVSPFREDVVIQDIGSPKEKFFRGLKENQYFYEKTITDLDGQHFIGKNPNIIFYDADHDPQKQFDNLTYLLPVFADQFILVVDDANFMGVVQSAEAFAKQNNLNIVFDRKILTTVPEDANSWWNGIHIMVLRK